MVELAIDPRLARAMLTANDEDYSVLNEVLTIASLMQLST